MKYDGARASSVVEPGSKSIEAIGFAVNAEEGFSDAVQAQRGLATFRHIPEAHRAPGFCRITTGTVGDASALDERGTSWIRHVEDEEPRSRGWLAHVRDKQVVGGRALFHGARVSHRRAMSDGGIKVRGSSGKIERHEVSSVMSHFSLRQDWRVSRSRPVSRRNEAPRGVPAFLVARTTPKNLLDVTG